MTLKESAFKEIKKLAGQAINVGFVISPIEEKPYNFEIIFSKNKVKNKLQVYFGKKGLKKVIQGNKLTKEFHELQSIVDGNLSFEFSADSNPSFEYYIGTDETGKGDFFGPLVIAGVVVDRESKPILSELNVRDSKDLNKSQIQYTANRIELKLKNKFEIIIINPSKYNQLYTKFQNVNKLLNWGHSKVIENLLDKHSIENVIVDQFAKTPLDISLKKEYSNINFLQEPKAEKHLGVAAASILARHELNKWFIKKSTEGIDLPKGASSEVDRIAKILWRDKIDFSSIAKLHFKSLQKIFEN